MNAQRGLELASATGSVSEPSTFFVIFEDKKQLTVVNMKIFNGADDMRVITQACAAPPATGC